MYPAYDCPLLGAFWTMMWIFLWILWFILLFRVIGDVFRDDSLSGWAKTGWTFFVIITPFLAGGHADEPAKLSELKTRGDLTEAEFQARQGEGADVLTSR